MTRSCHIGSIAALALVFAGRVARAQQAADWDPERVVATREGLEQLRSRLQLASQSTAYSSHLRALASGQAMLIDRRLADGDFRPGDRIFVQVVGEAAINDTFAVGPARDITLPLVGAVGLVGVLRADVQPFVRTYLSKYLRNPTVFARPLIPISVVGHVARPGFYTVPTGIALTQVLNAAGGPSADANLTKIEISRDGRLIWEGAALQQAMVQGRTVEQLGIRTGDVLTVKGGDTDFYRAFQTLEYALGIPIAIFSVYQIFKGK